MEITFQHHNVKPECRVVSKKNQSIWLSAQQLNTKMFRTMQQYHNHYTCSHETVFSLSFWRHANDWQWRHSKEPLKSQWACGHFCVMLLLSLVCGVTQDSSRCDWQIRSHNRTHHSTRPCSTFTPGKDHNTYLTETAQNLTEKASGASPRNNCADASLTAVFILVV